MSTAAFHYNRERAPHLEQPGHRQRLVTTAELIREEATATGARTFTDLGCGDGGLLSLVQGRFDRAWGYDFQPSNAAGWKERGVEGHLFDAFDVANRPMVAVGQIVAMTEVLEHLTNPRGVLRWVKGFARSLVCSSPHVETGDSHVEEHAWAWDHAGYRALLEDTGWTVAQWVDSGPFQIVVAR